MGLFADLRRRNVVKVAIAYVIISWLLLQVGEVLGPALFLPEWTQSVLAFFLILGFPIALFFAWAFELTPEGIKREHDPDTENAFKVLTSRKLDFVVIGLLVVAVVYFGWDNFTGTSLQTDDERRGDIITITSTASTNSIAVLPFVNTSGDPDNEFFSDGVSEEILNVLARIPELKVAARTSAFAYKGTNTKVSEIAEELGVDHVLEGSVRKAGNQVRVNAQLIQAEDGFQLWSGAFDRELTDIFAIQDEISNQIADALKLTLDLDSNESGNLTGTNSLEAYEHYLRGMALWHERTAVSLNQAIEEFESALEIDPDFAKAHAGMALVWGAYSGYVPSDFREVTNRMDQSADAALALDPNNVEAVTAKAAAASVNLDYKTSEEYYERAIMLNPSFATAYQWYARLSGYQGDRNTEIALLERALELDPRAPIIGYNLAWAYWADDQKHVARETIEQTMVTSPHFVDGNATLLMFSMIDGNCAEVERLGTEIVNTIGKVEDKTDVYVALCKAQSQEERATLMDEMMAWDMFEFSTPDEPALTYDLEFFMIPVAFGDYERGMEMLEIMAGNWSPENLDWYRHLVHDNMLEFNCLADAQAIYAELDLPKSGLDPVCD